MRRITPSNYNNRIPQTMEKITLDANVASRKRIFFIVLFVCIGLAGLVYGFTHLGGNKKGWQRITLDKYGVENCSYDFTFSYYLGSGKQSVNKERNRLIECYQRLTTHAYRVFDRDKLYEGIGNVCYVNQNVNREITVDPVLYQALLSFEQKGNREIYTCALSEHYDALIRIDSLSALPEVDPYSSEEVAAFFQTVAEFAADPEMVSLEFLSNNRLILHVSEAYLTYAKDNDIRSFIDFGWMKNAYIVDYLTENLCKEGFTKGILSSYDGFTRNFADLTEEYRYELYLRTEKGSFPAATLAYNGTGVFVNMRDYPLWSFDEFRFLSIPDGTIRNTYINPLDGRCEVSMHDMLTYQLGGDLSCSEIMLSAMPLYLCDSVSREVAEAKLSAAEIGLVTEEEYKIIISGGLRVVSVLEREDVRFFAETR